MMAVRAIRWYRDLARLGIQLPFFIVHDVGLLYASPREQLVVGPRPGLDAIGAKDGVLAALAESYRRILAEIAESAVSARASSMRLSDDLVTALLARVLGELATRIRVPPPHAVTLPVDPELVRDNDDQIQALFARVPRAFERAAIEALVQARLFILTLSDALDLDTLRLLGMLGDGGTAMGALAHVDLLAAMTSEAANDVVNFSLELLPSVLETHRRKSMGQSALDGYAGIGTKGSVDSLMLSELAWDEEEFARRFIENELLYYAREQTSDVADRLHYILVDASASMRGDRQVFARGLAIALAKKLQLGGEEVWLRFFDSRLYDVQRASNGHLPVAYLLGFKGERGRNPARVFAQLGTELALLRERDGRDPVVHLITHAALHVPRPLVEEVCRLSHLFGVFILPSGGKLDLEYLDLMNSHVVVDHTTLTGKSERAAAATRIVDDASRVANAKAASGPTSLRTPQRQGAPAPSDGTPPSIRR